VTRLRQRLGAVSGGPGFSLVELIIVLVILGVVAAIAAPRYASALCRYRADCAARRIVADLGLAQARARQTSQGQTLVFDLAANQLRIAGLPDLDRHSSDYTVRLGGAPYQAKIVSADFGGDSTIVFNGYGIPDSGGSVVVEVGDVQRTVVVSPATGKAQVQ